MLGQGLKLRTPLDFGGVEGSDVAPVFGGLGPCGLSWFGFHGVKMERPGLYYIPVARDLVVVA